MPAVEFPFVKMEGCGNDYVYLDAGLTEDAVDTASLGPVSELTRRLADRHTGIGGDGLILVSRDGARARMRMWNADGSEGKLCLNGLRCAAKLALQSCPDLGPRFAMETAAGERWVEILDSAAERTSRVRVAAGKPAYAPAEIPLAPGVTLDATPVPLPGGGPVPGTAVSVGNPHLVLWLASSHDVAAAELERFGPVLENDPRFPERMNVHVAAARAADDLVMRSWERGSGLTRACGSGAVAVYAVARRAGNAAATAQVHMPGGAVSLAEAAGGDLVLIGPATEVFRGVWRL